MPTTIIVESPAKAKTVQDCFEKGDTVLASYGHVRDLIPKTGAVEPDNDFAMHYAVIDKAGKAMDAIKKAVKKSDTILLATDPDREGEAIAWHIAETLREQGALEGKKVARIVFHQITKKAILAAKDQPRDILIPLVDAQQARRAMDYLVGFHLSPLLWKKIRRGLSAGRAQSPALRLIVERELEIEAFKAKEYWRILAKLEFSNTAFDAKLHSVNDDKIAQFTYTKEEEVTPLLETLKAAASGTMPVIDVTKKPRKRNPSAPFITSTLQQEAARKLGFTPANTMRLAQQLYEGMEVGQEKTGIITYMRTDSVHLADEAVSDIRQYIQRQYDSEYCPKTPPVYKTKSKNAQEAHEAIRPTDINRTPEQMARILNKDQLKLYTLIWQRTLASQMASAKLSVTTVLFACGDIAVFKSTGTIIEHPGFMAVYLEGKDDDPDEKETKLPALSAGDQTKVEDIVGTQHFTEPPPRFSEASLIKALEEHGIGRPSTYANILATLKQREYVDLEKKRFTPTELGRVVSKFLTTYFTQYVDYGFTANMEDSLDAIARNETAWKPVLKEFWGPFHETILKIDESVKRSDVTQEVLDEACPECQSPLSSRLGKRGRFVGCTNYPECRYTRNIDGDNSEDSGEETLDEQCPTCSESLVMKSGRYGKFIGCSGYPDCKYIRSLNPPKDTKVTCPSCKDHTILERKSKRGKIFFSCSGYPKCKYALWNPPIEEPCPKCSWPVISEKTTKKNGTQRVCSECDYAETIIPPEA